MQRERSGSDFPTLFYSFINHNYSNTSLTTNLMTFLNDLIFQFHHLVIWFLLNFYSLHVALPETESTSQINQAISRTKSGLPLRPSLLKCADFDSEPLKG